MPEPKYEQVKIFIDQESHQTPVRTSGAALYALGNVERGMVLFREVPGDREDPEVENGPRVIDLREDEHFHSGKPTEYRIIVNGQPKTVSSKTVSYDQIVELAALGQITGPNILYTVGYEDGPHQNPSGSLKRGHTVEVKNGMIFHVTPTDKS